MPQVKLKEGSLMIVLGLETSCDETGLALYDSEVGLRGQVLVTYNPALDNVHFPKSLLKPDFHPSEYNEYPEYLKIHDLF